MKTCKECGGEFPPEGFYKQSKASDGLTSKCKACLLSQVKKYRKENLEKVRAYDRERGKLPKRVKNSIEQTRAWRQADKRRTAAHNKVARALKKGELVPADCERCGSEMSLAHHENYDEPLVVMWLCQPCHKQRHKELRDSGVTP